jgi:hypothetical protein
LIVAVKAVLAALTPMGLDFVLTMTAVIYNDATVSWSPWIIITRFIYTAWLALPINHGDVLRALTASPETLAPAHYLLAAMVKSPLLFVDLMMAVLLRRIGGLLGYSAEVSSRVAIVWLMNPFTTFFIEMWGSSEVIAIAFTLASVLLILEGRKFSSALSLACGVALNLLPIVPWVGLLVWLHRGKAKAVSWAAVAFSGPVGFVGYFLWASRGGLGENAAATFFSTLSLNSYPPVTEVLFSDYVMGNPYNVGLAVLALATFYLICAEVWRTEIQELVTLLLSGLLILFAFSNLYATAFLWATPFTALSSVRDRNSTYSRLFYLFLAFFLLGLYISNLTWIGPSILFIPTALVPLASSITSAVSLLRSLAIVPELGLLARSVFSGFCLVYAGRLTWRAIRVRSK